VSDLLAAADYFSGILLWFEGDAKADLNQLAAVSANS
jgi:hypothetical protein